MGLTVLNVAFVFAPVGPDTAGGAEQVLAALDRALVAAGHRSLVVACAGSKTAGELLATEMLPAQFTEELRRRAQRVHRARIRDALRQWPVDLVHCHGHDFADYLPPPNVRTLVTLHLPVDHYPGEALAEHRPRRYFNCVSASQRRRFPANDAMLPEIPNGVPVAELQSGHAKRKFVLALGRICPEKGFHDALDAAALARTPLLLAGHVFPYPDHLQYFAENIQPRLGPQARFLGNLGLRRKRRFLTAARCLLMPSQIAETSSLVAMEAMACGTPVIAFPVGALPGDRRAWHHRISRRRHQANGRSHSHRREDRSRALPEGGSTAIFARENDCGIFRILSEAGSTMRVEPVTSQAAVDRLVPEWEALWRGVPDATPFQSPAWLASWWSCFGNEAPLVLTARDGQRLIAVLPLYIYDESECRKALPIGIGLSDYLDALVDPGHSGAIGLLLEALAKYRGWGECYIPDLPSGAALLAAQTPANVVAQRRIGGETCPVLTLPGTVARLRDVVPRKASRDLRQARRRAAAVGTIEAIRADARSILEYMQDFFRLHESRWRPIAGHGVCADPVVRDFHLSAAQRMLDAGMLRLYLLRIGGSTAAAYYGFTVNRTAYAYLSGFHPKFAELSPGTQIVAHAIEEAVREGAREFHFLRGGEAYKYAWGAIDRPNTVLSWRRRS